MDSGEIKCGIVIPSSFTRNLLRGLEVEIQVLIDGLNPTVAQTALFSAQAIVHDFSGRLALEIGERNRLTLRFCCHNSFIQLAPFPEAAGLTSGRFSLNLPLEMFVSALLYKKILDVEGEVIGRVSDFLTISGSQVPKIISLIAKKKKVLFSVPWECVSAVDSRGFHLKRTVLRPYKEEEGHILLARDVLDKQIVDKKGMKVVRVNDLRLVPSNGGYLISAVDVGIGGILRRLYLEKLHNWFSRLFLRTPSSREIPWQVVEPLGSKADAMKLKITVSRLKGLHPADLADIVEGLDREERNILFSTLDLETAAETIMEVEEPKMQAAIISSLDSEKASDILEEMSPDDAADLLADLPQRKAEELLSHMETEEAEDVKELLKYPENTAGGLMTTEYIALRDILTAEEAIDQLREEAPDAETIYYLYVVDQTEHLKGVLSLRELIISPRERPISQFMRHKMISVNVNDHQNHVAEVIDKYGLLAVPVVDDAGVIRGIVTVDDVLDLLLEGKGLKRRMIG